MSASPPPGESTAAPDPWDEYWRRTQESAAHKSEGPLEDVLGRFWSSFFGDALAVGRQSRLLDIACGNGAATAYAHEVASQLARGPSRTIALDSSYAALSTLSRRLPNVSAVVADARRTPFASGGFDVIVSQFGLEYAGSEGFEEAARLLAPGGVLAAITHLRYGAIFRENTGNLAAMKAVRESALLEAAQAVFKADFSLRQGRGGRARLRGAQAQLQGAIRVVTAALAEFGEGVAGGAVARLRDDAVHMHRHMETLDPDEAIHWAGAMRVEVDAYIGRMASMIDASIDEESLRAIVAGMGIHGLRMRICATLLAGPKAQPAAWVLVAEGPRKIGGPKPAVLKTSLLP